MAYITSDELETWMQGSTGFSGQVGDDVCDAATAAVDAYCGRTFAQVDNTTATARVFYAQGCESVAIDDCYQITSVKTDDTNTGTFPLTWTVDDYYSLPLNNVGPNGAGGWPITTLVARLARWFTPGDWPSVQVTAKWGWSAVPDDVKQATLLLGAELLASRNAPLGITAIDVGGIQVRGNTRVTTLLATYRTTTSSDGKFLVA